MPSSGGSERLLVEKGGSFSGLKWTPSGDQIVYQFQYSDSHFIEDEKQKPRQAGLQKKGAPLYRHITRLYYRLDGAGWRPKDRFHIWKVDTAW